MNHLSRSYSRRRFLKNGIGPVMTALIAPSLFTSLQQPAHIDRVLKTRGVVLIVDDILSLNWPLLANDANLTTIGISVIPSEASKFIRSDKGQQFLSDCKKYHIQVEYELHAMNDLLPRNLFDKNPEMFRMNKDGIRVSDFNCCPNSKNALEVISENAVRYAETLHSTTGRYFYWIEDGKPMCYCNHCKELTDSEQALLVENRIVKALRQKWEGSSLAHLAYLNTLSAPVKIQPEDGIFLEFAPINRSWAKPLRDKKAIIEHNYWKDLTVLRHGEIMDKLDENLRVFPVSTAQVLEYWIDVSLQSGWEKPAKKLEWYPKICSSDVEDYTKKGIQHITTFAVYVDEDYKNSYKDIGFVKEYGRILKQYAL
ncbi:MAG TPA: DUF4838 domain-containing protein [Flavitalea sp.]|nr:DUF4838 domain-containing protein [Flavitalea sp.]